MAAEGSREPLNVGVLYPPQFDVQAFLPRTRDSERPLEFRLGHYEENTAVRTAKRARLDADELRAMAPTPGPAVVAALAEAEAIVALDVPVDLLSLAPRLRWIQTVGAGVGQFDEKALWARKVQLTTAAGVAAPPIAEFVMGRILAVWKDFRNLERLQQQHEWKFSPGRLLSGCTLGIVGLGAIGSAVAERARAFGMRVIAIRRSYEVGMTSPVADELAGPADLPRLLEESDVVLLSAPETAETENLIGADQFALMKPGALLVNVARGSLLDEDALISALRDGRLRGAVLDVARQEPLPADSPLWEVPNLYLSPHSAPSQEGYFDRLLELFAANLVRYSRNDPLINLATPDKGY